MGHRVFRDSRVTTHVCLTARALGANGVIIADKEDKTVEATIREVVKRFGGNFSIESVIQEINNANGGILVVVGSEKMPGEVFKLADWNVSVTNQPMSEVAALAVFLDWHLQHRALDKTFPNGQVEIVPSSNQKLVRQVVSVQKAD